MGGGDGPAAPPVSQNSTKPRGLSEFANIGPRSPRGPRVPQVCGPDPRTCAGVSVEIGLSEGGASNPLAFAVLAVLSVQGWLAHTRSQSVGTLAIGIRVLDNLAQPAGLLRGYLLRGAAKTGISCVPLIGGLLRIIDGGMVFRRDNRTLHDLITRTWVVALPDRASESEPRLSEFLPHVYGSDGRDGATSPPAGTLSGAGVVVMMMAGALGVVACTGVVALVAIPNFVAVLHKAKRAEVPVNVDAIRSAELAYAARYGTYVAAGDTAAFGTNLPGKFQVPWRGDLGWTALGWAPDGEVRGEYLVTLTATGFEVAGMCDVDGDGQAAVGARRASPIWSEKRWRPTCRARRG